MAITKKQQQFLDEYLFDLNASAAAVRAGYSEASSRQTAYKILQKPEVKEAIENRMQQSRMSANEVIQRLETMSMGLQPTKVVTGAMEREEYDVMGALEKMGKIYALFQDKIELNISHLNITDAEDA